jgi:hypothetical protein
LQKSLSAEYIQYMAVQKWNGILPSVTSNSVPFINMDFKAK